MKKLGTICYYLFKYWYYKLILGGLGRKSRLYGVLKIEYPENIFIKNSVKIGKHAWLAANPLTGEAVCRLNIDSGVYIGNFVHIYCTGQITICEKVLISDKVYIADNLHAYEEIELAIIDQPIKQLKPVSIGEGSWIGEGVSIIGANVGKHSIIGANSVVTKDIPDYCIAVGAPAKIIKRYNAQTAAWEKVDFKGAFLTPVISNL